MTLKSRDEIRKERELEEARKAGVVPALTDELGNDINPHIPQYIFKAPWYLNHTTPSLKHQRANEVLKASIDTWHRRGVKSEVAIKYRKGACENCGAITHDSKSCVERPRKKGAKYTNSNICPDEYIVKEQDLGYDANRDRWAGFDPESHHAIVEEYHDVEEERAKQKISKLLDNTASADSDDDLRDDGDVLFDSKDSRTRTTTRNLRIREDTAKYLINLDVNSAFYDPKSRSMREDPLLGLKNAKQLAFRGDNIYYNSNETHEPKELEVFAWESSRKGRDVNFIADPTQLELLYKDTKNKERELKAKRRSELIEKYNASEFVENARELRHLVQVSKSDIVLEESGENIYITPSQYEEDVHILGHNEIWGSYYDISTGSWGYKCCKITNKQLNCSNS